MMPFYVIVWSVLDRTVRRQWFNLRSEADAYADMVVKNSAGHMEALVGMNASVPTIAMRNALWLRNRENPLTLHQVCQFMDEFFDMTITPQGLRREELIQASRNW